ncbi:MAG: type IV secretion system protein [Boseongicola sp.]|nr:type IV secretion system protein [Boseongicola sp.]
MHSRSRRILPLAATALPGLAALLWPDPALAQAGEALDTAVSSLEEVFRWSADVLGSWARQLLLTLLVLDLVWRGGRWAFSSQSFSDFAEPLVYTIGIVTLAWGFTNFVPDVVSWITRQATTLSNAAVPGAGSALTPSGILGQGLQRALAWVEAATWQDPKSWVLLVCAFIALVMMAAELTMVILVYAEMHLVGLVGIVTLGFAGLSQTRGIATRYVMSLIGKGFKLMTLLLVADVAHSLAEVAATVASPPPPEDPVEVRGVIVNDHLPSIPVSGVMAAVLLQMIGVGLMVTLPGAVERLVAGSAVGDAAGSVGTKVAGAAVTGGAAAGAAALGAAGGAVAGGAAAAKTAGAGAFRGGVNLKSVAEGMKAAPKGAMTGALTGGVNWAGLGAQGKVMNELGARLQGRVNSLGAGKPKGGPEGGS